MMMSKCGSKMRIFRKGISSLEQKLFNLLVLHHHFIQNHNLPKGKSKESQRKVKGKSKESISKG